MYISDLDYTLPLNKSDISDESRQGPSKPLTSNPMNMSSTPATDGKTAKNQVENISLVRLISPVTSHKKTSSKRILEDISLLASTLSTKLVTRKS